MASIYSAIDALIQYAIENKLIVSRDSVYCRNRLLELLDIPDYQEFNSAELSYKEIKQALLTYAYDNKLIVGRGTSFEDDFTARVMNIFLSKPSEIESEFYRNYKISPKKATDEFYALSKATDYIKTERVSKNIVWEYQSQFGSIDMTINLSKPEKTPEEIALAAKTTATSYPKCVLCKETEGLAGITRAPRQNHRIISLELDNRKHFLQYSPYAYFNEHLIVLAAKHSPMHLTIHSFKAMLDFVCQFEHYFLATNTDLPLVGGSILSHEHYQGGDFVFPLDKAEVTETLFFNNIKVELLNWAMSAIRVKATDKDELVAYIDILLNAWREYENEALDILPYTDEICHNTLNFVIRKNGNEYSAIVVFRNNRCNDEFPKGIFTARDEYRSIKNENIGIIEVMGLAILPARLKMELTDMKIYLEDGELAERSVKHKQFLEIIKGSYNGENIDTYLNDKIGEVFVNILMNCAVFKSDEKGRNALRNFINQIGEGYETIHS